MGSVTVTQVVDAVALFVFGLVFGLVTDVTGCQGLVGLGAGAGQFNKTG